MDESEPGTKPDVGEPSTPDGSDDRVRVSVRYWAGAAAAAGVDAEDLLVEAREGRCRVGALRRSIVDVHGGIDEVLRRCSLLLDGSRLDDEDELTDAVVVEVLPPFAGG